jgi:hypothetical protein
LAVLPNQSVHASIHFKGKPHSQEHIAKRVASRRARKDRK